MAALCFTLTRSRLFEIALVLVRFDHIASIIINANHSIVCAAEMFRYRRVFARSVAHHAPKHRREGDSHAVETT
jgi:hypothetical protein